jgi:hypothetical protein
MSRISTHEKRSENSGLLFSFRIFSEKESKNVCLKGYINFCEMNNRIREEEIGCLLFLSLLLLSKTSISCTKVVSILRDTEFPTTQGVKSSGEKKT